MMGTPLACQNPLAYGALADIGCRPHIGVAAHFDVALAGFTGYRLWPMLTSLQNRAGFLALRSARALILLLGLERGSAFMGWCWRSFAPLTKRHPRALAQIAASMPELDDKTRERIIADMWRGLGQTFAEGLVLDRLAEDSDRVILETPDVLADARRRLGPNGKPCGQVIVSMHAGNWETFGIGALNEDLHAAALYQAVANPLVEEELRRQRLMLWKGGLITKGSHAMKRVVGVLREGHAIGMLADHRVSDSDVSVPFFGLPAPSTTLPASLALKTGAALLLLRCKRVGLARYVLEMKELAVKQSGDHAADVEQVTAAIHAQFEAWIRERPSEWMWAHRRWSREVRQP
jgi:KDO2-lipid IV(A) lauroyltransferase